MEVRLDNRGPGDAFNVVATIECLPANAESSDPEVFFGDVPAGGSVWSVDSFSLDTDVSNPQDPNEGICWTIEYDDADGIHHVVTGVAEFCDEECSAICP
jgi:hypothetical protein